MTDDETLTLILARQLLVGRRIQRVFFMDPRAARSHGWTSRPLILVLVNGVIVYPVCPSQDNGGALQISHDDETVIPPVS